MTQVTIRRCDFHGCKQECDSPRSRKVTLHAHHDRTIDLCELHATALDIWLSLDGTACFSDEYENRVATEIKPPPNFPHRRSSTGAVIV